MPELFQKFIKGQTYTIDVSDASNSGHQLRFTADSGTTEYTTGVTATGTPGTAGATVTFAVPENAPNNLNYYCATHARMEIESQEVVRNLQKDIPGTLQNLLS